MRCWLRISINPVVSKLQTKAVEQTLESLCPLSFPTAGYKNGRLVGMDIWKMMIMNRNNAQYVMSGISEIKQAGGIYMFKARNESEKQCWISRPRPITPTIHIHIHIHQAE